MYIAGLKWLYEKNAVFALRWFQPQRLWLDLLSTVVVMHKEKNQNVQTNAVKKITSSNNKSGV